MDLEVPTILGEDTIDTDWDEYMGMAYLYWTPHKFLSLGAEYHYEEIESESDKVTGEKFNIETHRIPLSINFFHTSGLSVPLKATYYNQDCDFWRPSGEFVSASDSFWLVDAAIKYRLPKRYGFITAGVQNLFDKKFNYYETDSKNFTIQPDRVLFGMVTLQF
jgi:outer membrane receptor for ferrienterochelin and colicin